MIVETIDDGATVFNSTASGHFLLASAWDREQRTTDNSCSLQVLKQSHGPIVKCTTAIAPTTLLYSLLLQLYDSHYLLQLYYYFTYDYYTIPVATTAGYYHA